MLITLFVVTIVTRENAKADREMVKALDVVPYDERQCGHWLARNVINTKQKLGLGIKKKASKKKATKIKAARHTVVRTISG